MAATRITYDALDKQAQLHLKLANFYTEAAATVKAKAGPVVEDWRQWNERHAQEYDQWQQKVVNDLLGQAHAHMDKYTFFMTAKDAWQTLETAMAGKTAAHMHRRERHIE